LVAGQELTLTVRGLVLESAGYEVVSAGTLEDALRVAAITQPAVVICESLGLLDGGAIAECLKQLHPETPILLITGTMEAAPRTLAVDAVMTKIDGPQAFLSNVAALLDAQGPSTGSQAA